MKHVCIIAEAGVNHNGNYETAIKMINEAKKAGADYIKFQTFNPRKLVSKYAEKAEYQKQTTNNSESQLEMLEKLVLTNDDFIKLKKHADDIGIGFISTPFDEDSVDFLNELNMDFWKIPSGEVTNLLYLQKIAKTKKKIVMSTGMCNNDEIQEAINILESNGAKEIELLHCNTQYPTPYEDVNLAVIETFRNKFKKNVGYSDHTLGIEVPVAAVALGANTIEKHFTLDKNMSGPDHKASLNPFELKSMVDAIRHIEKAIGSSTKEITKSEQANVNIVRKSIVAKKDIKKGELFSDKNLTTKRPGYGISPMKWNDVIGKIANRDYKEDEIIEL